LTDAQADTINGLLAKLAALVEKALDDLVAKKPALAADNATEIAKSDLQALKTNSDGFGNAMLVKTPVRLSLLAWAWAWAWCCSPNSCLSLLSCRPDVMIYAGGQEE
jgi:hypothetical protein